jgi:hypothetical protein
VLLGLCIAAPVVTYGAWYVWQSIRWQRAAERERSARRVRPDDAATGTGVTPATATPGVSDSGTLWRGFVLLGLGLLLYAILPAGVLKTVVGLFMVIFDIGLVVVGVKAANGVTRGKPWPSRLGAAVLVIVAIIAVNIASGLLNGVLHPEG